MTLKTLDPLGMEVKYNDPIRSTSGDTARFIKATKARVDGKSGKVVVQWLNNIRQSEYYDRVFGLKVVDEPE